MNADKTNCLSAFIRVYRRLNMLFGPHQTRQAFWLTIGWPALHENAFWNSGMFCTVPFTR
jgi:hypothetical protein